MEQSIQLQKTDKKEIHESKPNLIETEDKEKERAMTKETEEYTLPDVIPEWHLEMSESETPLRQKYCLWYMRRASRSDYNKNIKPIGEFSTIEGFWRIYNHILRPHQLTVTTDYHIFKEGIKPIWEDPFNQKGGKWIIRLKKGLASYYWEILLFAIIGESFHFNCQKNICGAVLSMRYNEDIISLWNQSADDKDVLYKLRDHLRILLDLPYFVSLEYKRHDASLVDNSSFRNTVVWRGNNTTTTNNVNNNNTITGNTGGGQQNTGTTGYRYNNNNNNYTNRMNASSGGGNTSTMGQSGTGGNENRTNRQYHYHNYNNKNYNNNNTNTTGDHTDTNEMTFQRGRNYNNENHERQHRKHYDENEKNKSMNDISRRERE